jgi:SAM-dependent methyltransferase
MTPFVARLLSRFSKNPKTSTASITGPAVQALGASARERLDESPSSACRLCPICLAEFPAFAPYNNRPHARCPRCGSVERHRMSWLYLQRESPMLKRPVRMLHFAPERCLAERIRKYPTIEHVGASFDPNKPDEGVDIQDLKFADESFDLIYCSHVLEHVPDDRRAIRELGRVLKRDGVAVVLVPTRSAAETHEDPSIVDPVLRRKFFGQEDHLRAYGRDFSDRLRESGFATEIVYYNDRLAPEEQVRYGLVPEPIYVCRRT